jgi:hypothetical protein
MKLYLFRSSGVICSKQIGRARPSDGLDSCGPYHHSCCQQNYYEAVQIIQSLFLWRSGCVPRPWQAGGWRASPHSGHVERQDCLDPANNKNSGSLRRHAVLVSLRWHHVLAANSSGRSSDRVKRCGKHNKSGPPITKLWGH